MSKLSRPVAAVVAVTAALALAACSGTKSEPTVDSQGRSTVTLRHSWIPDDLMMPVVAAKQLGFYADENITVVDQVGNGGATSAQLVANGDVLVGVGEAAHVLNARNSGLPIVYVATQIQDQPNVLVTMKESGITTWEDVRGKTIGTTTTSSGHVGLRAALKAQGIDESEVTFVNFPAGAALTTLPTGEIDGAGSFLGNIAAVDFYEDVNFLTYSEAGYQAPSTGFFVHEKSLESQKDVLVRFFRATFKGLRYAIDNPDEVAELFPAEYANVDPVGLAAKWKLNAQFVDTPAVAENGLGYIDPAGWESLKEGLVLAEQIPADMDIKGAFSTAILDEIPLDERR